ncbi:radical S-adenosyl methionine domain-containing protein 1 [Physocladia obscura]|uniref:Radical S-adenosyl methionine domain-containing protein 1 n=1 Tax=Physocladia obscura TaxID=109957 RepID=A0AAD5XDR4_9FUNG|nr:radical S-adenosyl methionine domain-containing protein 1 [Physocladia obscura]
MPASSIKSIVSLVKGCVETSPNLEIALESNPSSLSIEKLQQFKADGSINRLSIGIQSFQDSRLKFLGRDHSSENALQSLLDAYKVFNSDRDTVSCDLMFGIPGQSETEWIRELNWLFDNINDSSHWNALKHMSLYQLTYEPGTPLWRIAVKSSIADFNPLKTSDVTAAMYEAAVALLHTRTNLRHYEVSNYAMPGHESVHNMAYWKGWDYIGVGPGAHGRYSDDAKSERIKTMKFVKLDAYIQQCKSIDANGTQIRKKMYDNVAIMKELIVVGLRVKQGICFENANNLAFGADVRQVVNWDAVERFRKLKLLASDDKKSFLQPTERGLAVIDSILLDLLL